MAMVDSYLDRMRGVYLNRYFGVALFGFWFLLYEYMGAGLPLVQHKMTFSLVLACLIVGITTYALTHDKEMAAVEETALLKLRAMLAAYIANVREEVSRDASAIVVVCCTVVSTTAKAAGLLVFLGAFSIFDMVKHSILSVFLTVFDVLKFFGQLLGHEADVVAETLQPVISAVTSASAVTFRRGAAAAAVAQRIAAHAYSNRTGLVAVFVCLDLVLPFNMIGSANAFGRALVLAHYQASLIALVVVVCIVVVEWNWHDHELAARQ